VSTGWGLSLGYLTILLKIYYYILKTKDNPENEQQVLVIGVEVGDSRQREVEGGGGKHNPENKHLLLIFRVAGGGSKVTTPKNKCFCLFFGLSGDGCQWVVGDQREVVTIAGVVLCPQPLKTSASARFLGWVVGEREVVMVAGGWWVTRGR